MEEFQWRMAFEVDPSDSPLLTCGEDINYRYIDGDEPTFLLRNDGNIPPMSSLEAYTPSLESME